MTRRICGMTAECQMGLNIEYACYSVQADEGLMKQADEQPTSRAFISLLVQSICTVSKNSACRVTDELVSVKSLSYRLFVKYCGIITSYRRKQDYLKELSNQSSVLGGPTSHTIY